MLSRNFSSSSARKRELIVNAYIHDIEQTLFHKKHIIPKDIHIVIFEFSGRDYVVYGIGDNTYTPFGSGITAQTSDSLKTCTKLSKLSSLLCNPFELYRGYGRLIVKDETNFGYASGYNYSGPCAVGHTDNVTAFTALVFADTKKQKQDQKAVQVISHGVRSCHTLFTSQADNKLYQVGYNDNGQACTGRVSSTKNNSATLVPSSIMQHIFKDVIFTEICTGVYHTLFLAENGFVYAVGRNSSFELGIDSIASDEPMPIRVPGLRNIRQIFVGDDFNLCVDEWQLLWGWGNNEFGQLAISEEAKIKKPTLHTFFNELSAKISAKNENAGNGNKNGNGNHAKNLSRSPRFLSIDCGYKHSGVVLMNGDCYLFGCNEEGQIGCGKDGAADSDDYVKNGPFLIPNNLKCQMVSLGSEHSLLLTTAGELYAWGSNDDHECGLVEETIYKPRYWPMGDIITDDEHPENYNIVRVLAGTKFTIIVVEC